MDQLITREPGFRSALPSGKEETVSQGTSALTCRCCGAVLRQTFLDLGYSPMANALLEPSRSDQHEPFYPLHVFACTDCHLVQLGAFETPQQIFGDYLYFSSFSDSWLQHARSYAQRMIERFGLNAGSLVVEVASNDGYLLRYFKEQGVPVLGVDPAANIAAVAIANGVPTEIAFFGEQTARRLAKAGVSPKLIVANNVLPHVPDLHDFVEGFRILLAPDGVATFEFQYLLRLVQRNEFDTIYHEHFSYLSLAVVKALFARHGLVLFDVEELPTHGGSVRIYLRHQANEAFPEVESVAALLRAEDEAGLTKPETYRRFAENVAACKASLLEFLHEARRQGKQVAAYGAPAKGNTLLNYCGIGPDLIAFTVDRNPHKQNRLLPGAHIPVFHPSEIRNAKPDYVLILPWNLRDEITAQMAEIRDWGGKFVIAIPHLEVF